MTIWNDEKLKAIAFQGEADCEESQKLARFLLDQREITRAMDARLNESLAREVVLRTALGSVPYHLRGGIAPAASALLEVARAAGERKKSIHVEETSKACGSWLSLRGCLCGDRNLDDALNKLHEAGVNL